MRNLSWRQGKRGPKSEQCRAEWANCERHSVDTDRRQLTPRSLRPFQTEIPGNPQAVAIYMATVGGFPGMPVRNGRKECGVNNGADSHIGRSDIGSGMESLCSPRAGHFS